MKRLLEKGEPIMAGDEMFNPVKKQWIALTNIPDGAHWGEECEIVRREVPETHDTVTHTALCNRIQLLEKQCQHEYNRWYKLHTRFLKLRSELYEKKNKGTDVLNLYRVKHFHQALNLPAPTRHTLLDEQARQRRFNLITEEAKELLEATTPVDQLDAVIDLMYVVLGSAVEMGLDSDDIEEAFGTVHMSNLLKAGGTMRPDGKLLKPEGWQPPNLEGIFCPV